MIWRTARQDGILALAVVVALAGFFTNHSAIMGLGLFFAILWWIAAWVARRTLQDLSVTSALTEDVCEIGAHVTAEMVVVNPLPWPILDVEWKFALPREITTVEGAHALAGKLWVGARQRVRILMQLSSESRGRYRIGPGSLVFRDPLSWNELIREDHDLTYLTVFPRRYPIPASLASWCADLGDHKGRPWDTVDPLRVVGVRPYQPGDSIRRLAPYASARLRRPMVKEWERVQDRSLEILLHPKTTDHHWEGIDRITLEDTVSIAAGVVQWALENKTPVGLQGSGSMPGHIHGFTVGHESRGDLTAMLTALAWLQPSGTMDEDLVEVLHKTLQRLTPQSLVVFVSPYWPEALDILAGRRRVRLVHLSTGPIIPETPNWVLAHYHWQEGGWLHV
ncbi:DUF58 domain-containing protein [Sulfobacillus harzensis]|uniref:DUF58 domain-containing protein n=1 Tax=Sulfobacillus harzensis TaxID=2729629 RepID=A0A7Y0L5N9_9FIRM|nr:DUF58 domain-containing protein [Sulfobacillus harzensis]NMP23201.1 DUF58 domain-containing protein [Sulfobacillus harzensis]